MRGFSLLRHRGAEPWLDALRIRRRGRVDLRSTLGEIRIVDQLCDRHLVEVRVSQVLRAVCKHTLFDFRDQVHVLRRIERHVLEVRRNVLFHLQQLHEADATRTRRRCGDHTVAVPVRLHRLTPHGLVFVQILLRDQTMAAHRSGDQVGSLAIVEVLGALVGNTRQDRGEIRLLEVDALLEVAEVSIEVGFAREVFSRVVTPLLQLLAHFEAVRGVLDGRRQHLLPLQLAETTLRFPHAFDRARHAHRAITEEAHVLDDVALVVEIHVPCR